MAQSRKDKQGVYLIGGSLAFMTLLAFTAVYFKPAPPCPAQPTRKTVLLVDQTEAMTTQTFAEIRARALAWITDSVRTGEIVAVYAVKGNSASDLQPVFVQCKLRWDVNRLFENAEAAKKNYRVGFTDPLIKALQIAPVESKRSPIAQALIDLSLSDALRADTVSLLVFSDLLENDRGFSVYTCSNPAGVVAQFRRARVGAQERPVFQNTRIQLHAIPRPGISSNQLRCRDALWIWFFGDAQGTGASLDLQYLPGGPATNGNARADR